MDDILTNNFARIAVSFTDTGSHVQVNYADIPTILQNFSGWVIYHPIYSYAWTTSYAKVEFPIRFTASTGEIEDLLHFPYTVHLVEVFLFGTPIYFTECILEVT